MTWKMEGHVPESELRELCTAVDRLSRDSGDIYGKLYEKYPQLERSIQLTEEETNILLNYFIQAPPQAEEGEESRFQVAQLMDEVAGHLEQVETKLLKKEDIDRMLGSFFDEEQAVGFSDFSRIVTAITDALAEIDTISINATIFASNMGSQGAGFRVVSDSIQSLSAELRQSNATIREMVEELSQWLQAFEAEIQEVTRAREQLTTEHLPQVLEELGESRASLEEVGRQMRSLLDNARQVIEPGRGLMVMVQNQDLIRQGLEGMHAILEKVEEPVRGASRQELEREAALDSVVFAQNGLKQCERLGGQVVEQLDGSVNAINERIQTLNRQIKDLLQDSREISSYFGGDTESRRGGNPRAGLVQELFDQVQRQVQGLRELLNDFDQKAAGLVQRENEFLRHLEEIERLMSSVDKQANNLKKLRLLSSIELARMDLHDYSFSEDIESVSREVISAIEENQDFFSRLKENLQSNLQAFQQALEDMRRGVEEALRLVESSRESLVMTGDLVRQAIHALHQELQSLSGEMQALADGFAPAQDLLRECRRIHGQLEDLVKRAEQEKEAALSHFSERSWSLEDRKLQNSLEQVQKLSEQLESCRAFSEEEVAASAQRRDRVTLF